MSSLIPYTNKQEVASSKQAFEPFIMAFQNINASLTKTDAILIKKSISENKVTIEELEIALPRVYDDPNRFGKVEWNQILKAVKDYRKANMGGTL